MKFNQLTPAQQIAIKTDLAAAPNLEALIVVLNAEFETGTIKLGAVTKSMIVQSLLMQNPVIKP
jgi:hypothetical protein